MRGPPDAPFTFVTDGVAAAVEEQQGHEIAGDKDVVVNGGTMATQCLELGLLDEITLDVVPVHPRQRNSVRRPCAGHSDPPRWPDDHAGEPVAHLQLRGAQNLNQRPAEPGADLDFQDT